ncbi:hypothetical protein HYC85_022642 [Camellia sinensis]|uniref:protein-serine/threonine phosphatase n=1 Tax=Camellia sinensis TaxID=4442 RepID=A0A7J7GC76_CAMSI|nr:hypothetical protein HYC85_022642 [Camellia sinensis]
MDPSLLDDIINQLLEVRGKPGKQVQLSESEIKQLCVVSRDIFLQQPNLLELEAPIKICGLYYDGNNGVWYSYDHQTQQYVPYSDQSDNKTAGKQNEQSKGNIANRERMYTKHRCGSRSIPVRVEKLVHWIGVAFLTCNNDLICLNGHFCLIRIHILCGVALVIVGFLVKLNKL